MGQIGQIAELLWQFACQVVEMSPKHKAAQYGVLRLRTVKVAVAENQFRVVQNVRDVGGESEALVIVIVQQHVASIRLQAAD